jgi:hypothetical protein
LSETQEQTKLNNLENFTASIQIQMNVINIEDVFDTDFDPLLKAIFQTQQDYSTLLQ